MEKGEDIEYIIDGNVPEIFGDYSKKIKVFSVELDGVVTDFAISDYANQLLIIITQFQKIGTLISVTRGNVKNINDNESVYDVRTICGLDSQDAHLAARYFSNKINITKQVLFAISLKDYKPEILKAIAKVLEENI